MPHTWPAKPSQVKSSQVKSSQVLLSFTFVPPAVPNGAGDHRAARTPPWRGAIRLAVRWSPPSPYFPTSGPPTCGSCARLSSSLSGAVDGDLFVPTMWAKPSPSLLIDVNGGSPAESRGLRSLRRAAPLGETGRSGRRARNPWRARGMWIDGWENHKLLLDNYMGGPRAAQQLHTNRGSAREGGRRRVRLPGCDPVNGPVNGPMDREQVLKFPEISPTQTRFH